MGEQEEILKQFNIVRVDNKSPAKEIMEVDLVDDSDSDDLGKYSDGGDDIAEVDSIAQEITDKDKQQAISDQELIDNIVRNDLASIRDKNETIGVSTEEDDDDIEIID